MELFMEPEKKNDIVYVYVNKVYQSQRDGYKRYYQKNAETIKEKQREYCKNRYETDPDYKAKKLEQARQRRALKKLQQSASESDSSSKTINDGSSK